MVGIQLDALLLRGRLPELVLRPGATVAARVADRASISIAGIVLSATLPEEVSPGQTLRLRIDEATPERLLLRIVDDLPQAPPGAALPLPGGAEARVWVEERDAEGGSGDDLPASVAVVYESPALGRIDLRLELPGEVVSALVAAAAGEPAERATAAADSLRQGMADATGREAQVRVVPRHDPLDIYA